MFAFRLVHHLWVKGRHRDRVRKGPEGFGEGVAGPLGRVGEAALVPYIGLPCLCPAKKSGAATVN